MVTTNLHRRVSVSESAVDIPRMGEPTSTAALLVLFGLLLAGGVLSTRASERSGVPAVLVFLGVGMLAGSDGLLGVEFADYGYAFRVGTIALVLILFDGGLNTPLARVRPYWKPAVSLATLGVLITGTVVGLGARALGLSWELALLLGAIVSSTDAAAIFSTLRGSGFAVQKRVASILELESGLNDPLAVLLTIVLTEAVSSGLAGVSWGWVALDVLRELVVGGLVGWGMGRVGVLVLTRVRLRATGLYPALTLALAVTTYGIATLVGGSGFLAAYGAALLVGNAQLPYRASLERVHDALAWLSQIGMFLLLGLLVYPSRLGEVAAQGITLALLLVFIARPLAVGVLLAPFGYPRSERVAIAWAGLKGAVPIILATFPVLRGVPGAERLFDLAFFIVVVSVLLSGGTMPWLLKRLGLESDEPPPPPAVLEIVSTQPLKGLLLSFHVEEELDVTGVPLSEIPFPESTAISLILRDGAILVPKGNTVLQSGDHVYVATVPADQPFVQLLFGRPEVS
jgi:cell volume regulation protein A